MKIIADTGRQIGKTTALIKLAAESGGVIVVTNRTLIGLILRHADYLGLKLKVHQVLSYRQILNGGLIGLPVQQILYFDDWDYKVESTYQLKQKCYDFQVGGIVTAKNRAEIETCLQNT